VSRGLLAITGGTGFVGSTLIRQAIEAGWSVRALARRSQPVTSGVSWVAGALDQPDSLMMLMEGAQAVIHVAGVTNTPTRAGFVAGNVTGTAALIAAAKAAQVARFIHVSSLSVREPQLSNYGWSKAEAETRVTASGLDWTMVRPPAIFGPGDTDHLDLFKAARFRILPMPPYGRLSVIEVNDLARLLLALIDAPETIGQIYEVDDGRDGGWSHSDYGRAIGAAAGYPVVPVAMPASLVKLGARLDRLLRGDRAKLTADRAAYYCHPDWVIDPARRPPASLWMPEVETAQGLRDTAAAYRAAGWL
jgi:uncharacterized protein YbjT (DUF2867 family)